MSSSDRAATSSYEVHELRFVRRARDFGFSVADIGELLDLWPNRNRQSSEVKSFVGAHIARLRDKIDQLEGMVRTLETLANQCSGDDRPERPIVKSLGRMEARPRP